MVAPLHVSVGFRMELPPVESVERFDEMRDRRQIAVSRDGSRVAVVETPWKHGPCDIRHFAEPLPEIGAKEIRLLEPHLTRVRAWMRMQDGRAGIYIVTREGAFRRTRLDELHGVRRSPFGILARGRNQDDPPDFVRYALMDGSAVFHLHDEVTVQEDGTLVVFDPCDGRCRRVVLRGEEAPLVHPMRGPKGRFERLRPLRWMGIEVMIARRDGEDVLWGLSERELSFGGIIDLVWGSPNGHAVAMLLRVPGSDAHPRGPWRKLVISGNDPWDPGKIEVIEQGRFAMHYNDLHWSPQGRHFAAKLSYPTLDEFEDAPTIGQETWLVTTGGERRCIPADTTLVDFIPGDQGQVLGCILGENGAHTPYVLDRPLQSVLRALNLRFAQGRVTFNALMNLETCGRMAVELSPLV